jgi:hypothetical protein
LLHYDPMTKSLARQNQPTTVSTGPLKRFAFQPPVRPLSIFTSLVILLAFASCLLLLIEDAALLPLLSHAPVSALPLLLIGLASLAFQLVTRPAPLELFKACIVSAAFLLWGIDQLLPTGWLATTLGDVVIILYVIDLGWMMRDRLIQRSSRTDQKVVGDQES